MRLTSIARSPVLVVLFFTLLFLVPQIREIALIAVESKTTNPLYYTPGIVLLVLCTSIYLWSVWLGIEFNRRQLPLPAKSTTEILRFAIRLARVPLFVILMLVLYLNLAAAVSAADCSKSPPFFGGLCLALQYDRVTFADIFGYQRIVAIVAIVFVCLSLIDRLLFRRKARSLSDLEPITFWLLVSLGTATGLFALTLLYTSLYQLDLVWGIAKFFGPIGAAILFLVTVLFALSFLQFRYDRGGRPWVLILVVYFVILNSLNWNDTYRMRWIAGDEEKKASAQNMHEWDCGEHPCRARSLRLDQGFIEWLRIREPIIDAFHRLGKPYPVFLVSAQGGGLYSAYHVAFVLAGIQDACPGFADHVFAISALSGGSLGGAVFSGLSRNRRVGSDISGCRPFPSEAGPNQRFVDQFLYRDYLAPVLATGLFADLPRAFLPLGRAMRHTEAAPYIEPIIRNDRSTAFESALRREWRTLHETGSASQLASGALGFFEMALRESWAADRAAPALFINVTSVDTGERLVLSPFDWPKEAGGYENMHRDSYAFDRRLVSVSSALSVSARFPFITPPATALVARPGRPPYDTRLADGGYYENSGALTTKELVRDLRNAVVGTSFEKRLQFRTLSFATIENDHFDIALWGRSFNDLFSPIRAYFNVRAIRGFQFLEEAQIGNLDNEGVRECLVSVLSNQKPALPLAWTLSERSYREIRAQAWPKLSAATARPEMVTESTPRIVRCVRLPGVDEDIEARERNAETIGAISRMLTGK